MSKINIAIAGVGNCASALLQGIEMYKHNPNNTIGLMNYELGGYKPGDINVVAAFDIDRRKVGKKLKQAIFSEPNCTTVFYENLPDYPVTVQAGPVLDGVSEHMCSGDSSKKFLVTEQEPCDVGKVLRESGAEILINYLPVGSEEAVKLYAKACLDENVGFINAMPVFIASNESWAEKFKDKGIPLIGDDVKSQLGATIVHRTLTKLFQDRGVLLDRTYQLNFGGNTDFLNMLNRNRLTTKKKSKTQAVQAELKEPLTSENIHIGPSDYVPWLNDNKICYISMEGRGFGNIPLTLEVKLSVEDSPNSGGVVIDAIRCMKLARDRNIGGLLTSISAYTMKSPPIQYSDNVAKKMVAEFIAGRRER